MSAPVILSHYQASVLLAARRSGAVQCDVSPDLNLTVVTARCDGSGVTFPDGSCVGWSDIEAIAESETGCFALEPDGLRKIQVFSEQTNRPCSLMPTAGPPTLLIAGFPMHRIKGTDPRRDTLSKVRTVAPLTGSVLDTSTGLGYTAIEAARTAREVITIELDPAVLEVARQNPWSRALFTAPNIRQVVGDSAEEVTRFAAGAFTRIIHDPPTIGLAGDLYARDFYRELFRVLAPRGRLFHYIGDLSSDLGRRVARGAAERLEAAGFSRITPRPEAFGLVAIKGRE